MSRRSYSKHIPDFRLISHYAENGRSHIHGMNAWTKAALLGCVLALAIVLTGMYLLLLLYFLSLVYYVVARLPLKLLIGWYSLPVFFVVTLTLFFLFTEPGKELVSFSLFGTRVVITDAGVLLLAKLMVRALAVVTFSLALIMTTRFQDIGAIASRLLPSPLANMFLLSYRFTFETTDEVSDVLDAMHSRSGNLVRGITRQTRMFAGIFGLGFIHAFERGERIAKAMEARGFSGKFPEYSALARPSAGGYAMVAFGTACFALALYARYFDSSILGGM